MYIHYTIRRGSIDFHRSIFDNRQYSIYAADAFGHSSFIDYCRFCIFGAVFLQFDVVIPGQNVGMFCYCVKEIMMGVKEFEL